MEEQITIEYHGPLVDLGRMDAYQTAANIMAFSDFVGVVSRNLYGQKAVLRTEIQGFRKDSFDIDFALTISGALATVLFAEPSTKDMISLTKDCVKAWLHLRGKPPKAVERVAGEDKYKVENNTGSITYINGNVFNIITDERAGKAVEQFIKTPLVGGVDAINIRSQTTKDSVEVGKEDAECFTALALEKPLLENTIQMGLVVESAAFKEGNKWKFFDGQTSFYAEITDQEFLERVNSGRERFGKGDILMALVKIMQAQTPSGLKTERYVIKVIEHRLGYEQLPLV